ncbi:MAG: methyltransferase domain-containing protein [Thermoleophilia bacterium]|nr:methyltransferase domain-containing protein [Thermoleophilia bacterium]
MAGATSNKTKSEPEPIDRLRTLLKARGADGDFDASTGYLDLIDGRKEPVNPATIAMQLPLVSAIYERYWRPGFTRIAKGINGPGLSAEYEQAHQLLRIKRGDVVLDLACGPGNFSRRFARAIAPDGLVVGYDGSKSMLDRAVREALLDETPSLAFAHGEATALPFKAGSFDSVCCFAALHMFPEPFETLSEVARVLKPGGRVALMTSSVSGDGVSALAARALGTASGMKMFTETQIRDELEQRGFTIETQESAGVTQLVGAILN